MNIKILRKFSETKFSTGQRYSCTKPGTHLSRRKQVKCYVPVVCARIPSVLVVKRFGKRSGGIKGMLQNPPSSARRLG